MTISELVWSEFTVERLNGIAEALSEPERRIHSVLSAAIPSVLLLITDKVATPEGADMVLSAVGDRYLFMLDQLPTSHQTQEIHHLVEFGTQHLQQFVGHARFDEIVHALAHYNIFSPASAQSVLSIVTTVILMVIGRHIRPLNAHSLATSLAAQQTLFATSLPVGLHEYFDQSKALRPLTHLYDVGSPATSTDDAMENRAGMHRHENAYNHYYYHAAIGDRIPANLVWVVSIILLCVMSTAIIYTIFTQPPQATAIYAPPIDAQLASVVLSPETLVLPSDIALGKDITDLLNDLSKAMVSGHYAGLQAVVSFNEKSRRLEGLAVRISHLPASEKNRVSAKINTLLPLLEASAARGPLLHENTHAISQQILRQLHDIAQEQI